jgi:hypothetical protein
VLPERGNETNLYILGQQNGNSNNNGTLQSLQLNIGLTVSAGGNAGFTIDFVLRKGLIKPVNSDYYLLRPALRLVNNVEVGTISGRVENAVIATYACSEASGTSVYLYEGDLNANEQVPDDIYDPNINANINTIDEKVSRQRPISSAEVSQNDLEEYTFTIGFVRATEAGYRIALTCQSSLDKADSDNDISFIELLPVVITANGTSDVAFTSPQLSPQ